MSRAYTSSTFGHNKSPKEMKKLNDAKTRLSGVAREIAILIPSLPIQHATDLAQLMGKDGVNCLKSHQASFEISVLISRRYQAWLKNVGYPYTPSDEVRREDARRISSNGTCNEDAEKTITLLKAIFNQLSQEDINELAKLVCKQVLKIIWVKHPLLPLKNFCLENHQDWLKSKGVDVAAMTTGMEKSLPTATLKAKKTKAKILNYCEICNVQVKNIDKHIKEVSHKLARLRRYGLTGI